MFDNGSQNAAWWRVKEVGYLRIKYLNRLNILGRLFGFSQKDVMCKWSTLSLQSFQGVSVKTKWKIYLFLIAVLRSFNCILQGRFCMVSFPLIELLAYNFQCLNFWIENLHLDNSLQSLSSSWNYLENLVNKWFPLDPVRDTLSANGMSS